MKKSILLLFTILLFACSGDEGGDSMSSDTIVGKWQLGKEVIVFENNETRTIMPTECDLLTTLQFYSNQNFLRISYIGDYDFETETETNCELEIPNPPYEYARWENLGNNSYELKAKRLGESEETQTLNAIFSNSNNTFSVIDDSDDPLDGKEIKTTEQFWNKVN